MVSRCQGFFDGFPHASGGVSHDAEVQNSPHWFSPREWGCFRHHATSTQRYNVFPTRVGVFLSWENCVRKDVSFPHASGGVSFYSWGFPFLSKFSPREWGCFYLHSKNTGSGKVFPTRVGVFPRERKPASMQNCFPHASGGVSGNSCVLVFWQQFSPREWGCFRIFRINLSTYAVFPTRVGVFLR